MLAYLLKNDQLISTLNKLTKKSIIAIYVVGIILIFSQVDLFKIEPKGSHYLESIIPVIYAFFFAFIIAEQVFSKNSFIKFGRISFLTQLGKISYGLYCYHILAIFIVFQTLTKLKFETGNPGNLLFASEVIMSFILTIILSFLSFYFFEKKFLAYKTKISSNSPTKR